jgi:hypothetical protein
MNADIKSTAISEAQAIGIVGLDNINKVKAVTCAPTSRCIDAVYGVQEWAASIICADMQGEDRVLTINYLVDNDDADRNAEDMGSADWSNYTYEVI